MIDEAGPKDSKGHTPSEPPKTAPKVPSQPVNPPKGSSITTIDEKPTPDKPQPIPNSPRWRRFKGWIAKSWRERKKSSFTDKVIMAATVAIAFYAFLQHIDSKYTGTQTDRIIVADERLATAMENSVKEAESALNASIEASRTDQRAWIGPGDAVTPQDLRVGGTPVFSVVMLNTGKTPALHIETSVIWKPTYPSEPFKPTYGAGLSQRSVFVLFPNNHGVTVYSRGQSAVLSRFL
jgi:hypothetical protein